MNTSKPRKKRRLWLWLGVPTLLLMIAALGVALYVRGQVDRRLAAAIAEADRDDPNWRIADVMANREAIPDE